MSERITIVGAGVSGRALAEYAVSLGDYVTVTDSSDRLPAEVERRLKELGVLLELGGHSRSTCCVCDRMLVSSGVPASSPAVKMALEAGIPVCGELDFLAPRFNGRIIAVTGTNGKTTTTALIAHLLKSNGIDAVAAGNIGEPLAHHAGKNHDAIVMELSSFQLHWNTKLVPDVSILTNLAPDHINWHGSYENYIADKCRIFNMCGRTDCYAVTQSGDACRVPHGRRVCTLGGESGMAIVRTGDDIILKNSGTERKLFSVNKLKLVGRHNLENASMAAAAVVLAFPDAEPELGMESFVAPRHRCEYAGTVHGVTYINDSKGTNVASVVTALRSIGGRKIIILGGQGKGEKYDLLAETVRENTKASIVLGSEREAITEALKKAGCKNISSACDMADAVKKASEMAENGDIVLLSPACTSWDMYSSYEQRGDHFVSLVRGLEKQ